MNLLKIGLSGYFNDQLLKSARMTSSYVIEFDESMNPQTKTCQMNFHVRFWYDGQVGTFYYGSTSLEPARADILNELRKFFEVIIRL